MRKKTKNLNARISIQPATVEDSRRMILCFDDEGAAFYTEKSPWIVIRDIPDNIKIDYVTTDLRGKVLLYDQSPRIMWAEIDGEQPSENKKR